MTFQTSNPSAAKFAVKAVLASLLVLASGNASAAKLDQVLAARELRVCIWPEYYGITFRNPKTGQLSGIDIDVAQALGLELGVRVRFVDSSFPQLVPNLQNNVCDIAMHAVGITPQRAAALAFTQPYMRSGIYAVVSAHAGTVDRWEQLDQPGRVIAVQAGTFMEPVMRATLRYARLAVIVPPMQRETEVESGRADAFMTDFPYSQRMLATTSWARVLAPAQPFSPTDYAYALAPGDPTLLERVNRFMQKLRSDGRLQGFAEKYRLSPILLSTPR